MVYCTNADVYRVSGIDSSVVSTADVGDFILEAQSEIDRYFNTTFETTQDTITTDGNGTNKLFTQFYPIDSLDSLTIDGTSVTTSEVYVYSDIGKLQLKTTAEETIFKNTEPQTIVTGKQLDKIV